MSTGCLHDVKMHFSKLREWAHARWEIIVEKAGNPCARRMPSATASGARRPGRLAGRVGDQFFEPLPSDEFDAWHPA